MFWSKDDFKHEYRRILVETCSQPVEDSSVLEKYQALVRVILNRISVIRTETSARNINNGEKKVYYFSMEFLIGKLLKNYLIALKIEETVRDGLNDLEIDLDELYEWDCNPSLGNGGLGRLAACFMDSMASLGVPSVGMGMRYRFGLFRQRIVNGYQIEEPDNWLENGYLWEQKKIDDAVEVRFGGYVERQYKNGRTEYCHKGYKSVCAVPYDVPIVGYGGKTVNVLRLWDARPMKEELDISAFNKGDYSRAMAHRNDIEAITCLLYPDDNLKAGKELRLKQEYFLCAAGVASIIRKYKKAYGIGKPVHLSDKVSIHINDTHPALCVPEMMRVLMDEEGFSWDEAWKITKETISFTNHTILPEALEKWNIDLMRELLPRVYMIIEEIDRRWGEKLGSGAETRKMLRDTAILWDGKVNMANLSVIGSYSVNGVAKLHTDILKGSVFKDFNSIGAAKFNSKTNGVSHRRFLLEGNPKLAELITESLGREWICSPQKLSELKKLYDDSGVLQELSRIKRENKSALSDYIFKATSIKVDPDSVFDVQVKRIHAYKRQLLNAFKILGIYYELKEKPNGGFKPCTFIFAGKAAQGYAFAKEVIKFINTVADMVNADSDVNDVLKVVFIENFNVDTAQKIYPAADISEQISTAGKEASGTGNMKFMMNGAVTLGTLDGANIEIKEAVGRANIKIFGITADEAERLYTSGGYSATQICRENEKLGSMVKQLTDGTFKKYGCDFWGIYDALIYSNDEFFVLKDYEDYVSAWKDMVNVYYNESEKWQKMSLMNIACSGSFSSDRTISEYCEDIWKVRYDKR